MDKENSSKEHESVEDSISKDYIPKSKIGNLPVNETKKTDKTKDEIEKFKKEITKKFNYIEAIGIVPVQANHVIEEEFEIPEEEKKKKLLHILVIVPEEKLKEIGKIKSNSIEIVKRFEQKFWVHVFTPVDLWNVCLDSKFDIIEAFGMSFPVLDKGILGALRVAEIHKTLVLKKFEKYVTTYVIAGSLARGEAKKTSDVDVFIIIDDTDVKRMSRLELKEKLRGIIYSYVAEATAIAGVKNILNVQVYLLTEFWDGVKDAHPVFFTFIRDGYPLYDRNTFLPWKSLLRMGKIKPSSEAIDMYMSAGDKLEESINHRLLDVVAYDIYWGVLTPSQALLMLYGLTPPTPKETVRQVKEVFYEKEKILEKKYVDILEKIVSFYKDFEHGKVKKVSGKQIDEFLKDTLDYIKRLKELRENIEKRVEEKSISQAYDDVFNMLGIMLNEKSEKTILEKVEKNFVKQGKFPQRFLDDLKFLARVNKELDEDKKKKDDKLTGKEASDVDRARKIAIEIINILIDYNQRCDFLSMDKSRFVAKTKDRKIEIFFLKDIFVVDGSKISKLEGETLKESNTEELKKQLLEHQGKETIIEPGKLADLKKILGKFELVY